LQAKAGCQQCGIEKSTHLLNKRKKLTFEKFLDKFNKIHQDIQINFNKEWWQENYKNTYTKISLICPIHGEFKSKINNILMGTSCPKCNESKGERKIRQWLEKNNINYIYQYKIKYQDRNFYFDFYIPKLNLAIEYDGIFHFENPINVNENKIQKERDKLKNQYCQENNINLLRIPYWDFKKIDEILEMKLNFKGD